MIHVLTVHWKDDRWIDIQLNYLNAFIKKPFQVYAFLNHLPADHSAKYFYSSDENISSHPVKLNLLADMACFNSRDDDDWLIFIDGDAFPIDDVVPFGQKNLEKYPLIAVQRKENFGDIQPHPCFCLTTVGFWKSIKGDWKEGFEWANSRGEKVTDVGGNLLAKLEKNNIDWLPLLRSNKFDLHPVFFGIYNDFIYHHGAAFRLPYTRVDAVKDGKIFNNDNYVISAVKGLLFRLKRSKTKKINRLLVKGVFDKIINDFNFYKMFINVDGY